MIHLLRRWLAGDPRESDPELSDLRDAAAEMRRAAELLRDTHGRVTESLGRLTK